MSYNKFGNEPVATGPDGVIHRQDGLLTRCGLDRTGWSTAVTVPQALGLAVFCPDCTGAGPVQQTLAQEVAGQPVTDPTGRFSGTWDVVDDSFTCPKCKMTSHNPNDVAAGYCGNCHEFTGTGHRFGVATAAQEAKGEFHAWAEPVPDGARRLPDHGSREPGH